MKLEYEEKRVPTFRQWVSKADLSVRNQFDIVRIFCNSEWRTITFITEEFKLNYKYPARKDYDSVYKQVKKVLGNYCRAFVEVQTQTTCSIQLLPASDADEQAVKFESDDLGFERVS